MTGNQNNDVFQSTNSPNFERRHQQNQLPPPASELSSENSGFSMVINLPTLLRALKKSSLQQQKHQQYFAEPTQQCINLFENTQPTKGIFPKTS